MLSAYNKAINGLVARRKVSEQEIAARPSPERELALLLEQEVWTLRRRMPQPR